MDIENDLEKFKKLGYQAIYNELDEIEQEIRTKKYFFKVVHIINELEKLIKNDIFKDAGIYSVKLRQKEHVEVGQVFDQIEILNNQNEIIQKYNSRNNYIAEYELIKDLLSADNFILKEGLYNPDINKKNISIPLNGDAKNILKNYLFNEKLLKMYNYMDMLDKNPQKNNKEKTSTKKI